MKECVAAALGGKASPSSAEYRSARAGCLATAKTSYQAVSGDEDDRGFDRVFKAAARAEARSVMEEKIAAQLKTLNLARGRKASKKQYRAARRAADAEAKASFLAAGGSEKEYKREKAKAARESVGNAMMDCVEGKIEELGLEEGAKASAAEMRAAKADCKADAETAFLNAGGREEDFKKARKLSSRTRAIDSLEDCIADVVGDPKTASRRDIVNARTQCLADAQEKFVSAGGEVKSFKK